jgi:hypothetical protein
MTIELIQTSSNKFILIKSWQPQKHSVTSESTHSRHHLGKFLENMSEELKKKKEEPIL